MRSNHVKFATLDGATVIDTWDDWRLYLTEADEPKPDGKWNLVDVPGRHGKVDLSSALTGEVMLDNRTVDLEFARDCGGHDEAVRLLQEVAAALHVKRMQIQTPDASVVGGWYIGNCQFQAHEYPGGSVIIKLRAECDPFIYGSLRTVSLPASTSTERTWSYTRRCDNVTESFGRGAAQVECEYNSSYTPEKNFLDKKMVLTVAGNGNLFDPSLFRFQGKSISRTGTWTDGRYPSIQGSTINVGSPTVNYCNRAVISASPNGIAGTDPSVHPVFPLIDGIVSGGRYITIWVTSDKVTAVNATAAHGITAGVTVKIVTGATGAAGANGLCSGSVVQLAHLDPPAVGEAYDEKVVVRSSDYMTGQIYIDAAWFTCPNVYVNIMYSDTEPDAFVEPDVRRAVVSNPEGLMWAKSATGDFYTDTVVLNAWGPYVVKRTAPSSGGTAVPLSEERTVALDNFEWPAGNAQYVDLGPAWGDGTKIVHSNRILRNKLTEWSIGATLVQNGAMEATPAISTSAPTLIEAGGVTVIATAGEAQLLPVTIRRGAQSISHAVMGSEPATLSWRTGEV